MITMEELFAKIDAREKLDAEITQDMAQLGVDAKKLKAVKKARDAASAAQKTLNELMGFDPETAAVIAPPPPPTEGDAE